jgi:hypothetical protein
MAHTLNDAKSTLDELFFESNLKTKDIENEIRKYEFYLNLIKFAIRRLSIHLIK